VIEIIFRNVIKLYKVMPWTCRTYRMSQLISQLIKSRDSLTAIQWQNLD